MKKNSTILFLFALLTIGLGQTNLDFVENGLPTSETVVFRSSVLLPERTALNFGTIQYGRSFAGVGQYYLVGDYVFGTDSMQTLGLLVHLKDRGNLITETAAKIAYRQSLRINSRLKVALSASAGLYQITLEGTNTTPSGGDQDLDIDVSVGLFAEKWKATVFLGNLNTPELILLDEGIVYAPYYGGSLQRDFIISSIHKGTVQANAFYQLEEIIWQGSYLHEWYGKGLVGVNLSYQSLGFTLGARDIPLSRVKAKVLLGYSFPYTSSTDLALTPFQLQLRFSAKGEK